MSEIIVPNSAPAEPLLPTPGSPIRFPIAKSLSPDQINEAHRLFGNWVRANAIAVVTPQGEAEKQNTGAQLAQFFLQYGGELIGAWVTIHNEYQPILRAFMPIVGRTVSQLNAIAAEQGAK